MSRLALSVVGDHQRAEVVRLWSLAGLTRPWNDPWADLDRALRGPDSTVLVAVEGCASRLPERSPVIGTVMVGHDGHRGWVYYLAVHPDRRGRGYGGRLMDAAATWVRDRGIVKIQLMVRSDNVEALGFYRRLGYQRDQVTVLSLRLAPPGGREPDAAQPHG